MNRQFSPHEHGHTRPCPQCGIEHELSWFRTLSGEPIMHCFICQISEDVSEPARHRVNPPRAHARIVGLATARFRQYWDEMKRRDPSADLTLSKRAYAYQCLERRLSMNKASSNNFVTRPSETIDNPREPSEGPSGSSARRNIPERGASNIQKENSLQTSNADYSENQLTDLDNVESTSSTSRPPLASKSPNSVLGTAEDSTGPPVRVESQPTKDKKAPVPKLRLIYNPTFSDKKRKARDQETEDELGQEVQRQPKAMRTSNAERVCSNVPPEARTLSDSRTKNVRFDVPEDAGAENQGHNAIKAHFAPIRKRFRLISKLLDKIDTFDRSLHPSTRLNEKAIKSRDELILKLDGMIQSLKTRITFYSWEDVY